MSDVICPYCGATNSSDDFFCKSCYRTLPGEDDIELPAGSGSEDWLDSLRGSSESSDDSEDNPAEEPENQGSQDEEQEEEIPEWLQRIRQRSQEDQAPDEPEADEPDSLNPFGDSAEDLPDWLKEFQANAPEPSEKPETPLAGEQDWTNPFEDEKTKPAEQTAEDQVDWLKDLGNEETNPQAETPLSGGGLDWAELAGTGQPDQTEPSEPAADRDWLSEFAALPEENEPEASQNQEGEDEEKPDWLAAFQAAESQENPAEEGHEETPGEEQRPDWLGSFESYPGQDEETTPAEQAPAEEVPTPDWLKNFGSGPDDQADEPGQEPAVPDWVTSMNTTDDSGESNQSENNAGDDWLGAFQALGSDTAAPGENRAGEEEQPAEIEPESELPDWLANLQAAQEGPIPPENEAIQPFPADLDFLASIGDDTPPAEPGDRSAQEDQTATTAEPDEAASQPPAETHPEKAFEEDMPEITPNDLDIPAFSPLDLPDWFKGPADAESPAPIETPAEEGEPGIEPAQLPGWLQAMRPVESVMPEEARKNQPNEAIEKSGPLAGYQGILPGDASVTRYTKPPIYSARLQVSEKQQAYADLLENLVHAETEAGAPAAEKSVAPQMLLRILIGLVLIVFLGFILFSGVRLAPLPTLYSSETAAFFNGIKDLRLSGSPVHVLVGMDYESGLAGEMQALSSGVIEDLAGSAARLTFVADTTAGPAFTDQVMANVAADVPNYSLADNTVNLGYLAGGTSALASLAANPAYTAPYDLSGASAWTQPALTGLSQLSDFDAVLLISDNPENARAWIEQLGPYLGQTPFLVIASAQAGPMIQPYFQSGQIAGLLNGMQGSAGYASLSGQAQGLVARYWDAYQSGLLLVVLIILVGNLIQGVRIAASRLKPANKG